MVSNIKKAGRARFFSFLTVILISIAIILLIGTIRAINSSSNGNATLSVWTNGTLTQTPAISANLTFGSTNSKTASNWNFYFYANYTNSTNSTLGLGTGANCTIQFNNTGTYGPAAYMEYNSGISLWQSNSSFNYKGPSSFRINCTSNYGNITLSDNFTIQNSPPQINKVFGNTMTTLSCNEDSICLFNISANTVDDDFNDKNSLTFSIVSANTTLPTDSYNNYTFTSSGFLTVNKTRMNQSTPSEQLQFIVTDSSGGTDFATLPISTTAINDPPLFTNLNNISFNVTGSSVFNYTIFSSDEENNFPYKLNITFLNCSTAQWSNRNSTQCDLFNSTQYAFDNTTGTINISFIPSRNDVGNYTVNFTISDSGNTILPFNATTSKIVTFSMNNANQPPYFTYACNNENTGIEKSIFNCRINVTDLDEVNNLTISANQSWFLFNGTNTNHITLPVNISTGFNASFIVNFTPDNTAVGNWSINISITDTGVPTGINSTVINLSIANTNDPVSLQTIDNLTAYTTGNVTLLVNASDNDLLIISKYVYNESITFRSNLDWVRVISQRVINNTNITQATIAIYPNSTLAGGTYNATINVTDANNFSFDSKTFSIIVSQNSPPLWNTTMLTSFNLTEGNNFYLNLSKNFTDPDGITNMTFTFTCDQNCNTFLPSFSINSTTGIVNFTPDDSDVGFHALVWNVTDNAGSSDIISVNLTIDNIPDQVYIMRLNSSDAQSSNYSISQDSTIHAYEDNYTFFYINAEDNDLLIKQPSFYNESIKLNITILSGPNLNLFSPDSPIISGNKSSFGIHFTSKKSDVGTYNVLANVSDLTNNTDAFNFTIIINSVQHSPNISPIPDMNISFVQQFSYDVNSTDVEDINESTGNLTYTLYNLTSLGNFLNITNKTGIITNSSFLKSGIWNYSVQVEDSSGLNSTSNFTLRIYDYPDIVSPSFSTSFNLAENKTYYLNFTANHTAGDPLIYSFYLNNILRNQTASYGNGSSFFWNFTTNFTDETTCSGPVNLTLNVSNPEFSNSSSWSTIINHTNYPISLSSPIPTQSGGSPVILSLSSYFSDLDVNDLCVNQTVVFLVTNLSGTGISISSVNWTHNSAPSITFSSSSDASANFSITALEYNSSNAVINNISSNNFSVSISVTSNTPSPSSGGGGGGGGGGTQTVTTPIELKLILPGPISADKKDLIVVPITVYNNGGEILNHINLSSSVFLNGSSIPGVTAQYDTNFIDSLGVGQMKNVTLTIKVDTLLEGLYEININATVENPKFSDWGKIYLTVKEGASIERNILFADQLLVDNPECAEVKEIVNQADIALAQGNLSLADSKVNEAINACKKSIEQINSKKVLGVNSNFNIFYYTIWASGLALVGGIGYYMYKRIKLRRALMGYE